MRSRDRSSSQIETPAADSSASRSVDPEVGAVMGSSIFGWSGSAGRADALLGSAGDGGGGDAELVVELGVLGAGPEVLERDAAAGVPDHLAPALGDGGLDAHPGAQLGRQD